MGRSVTPAIKYSEDDPAFQIAKSVLSDLLPKEPAVSYVGGSVPALAFMRLAAGRDLITFGFQREDENFHAPNEFMRVPSFELAQRAYVNLLHAHRDQPLMEASPPYVLNEAGEFVPVSAEAAGRGQ